MPLLRSFGSIWRQMTSSIVIIPKKSSLCGNTSFEQFSVRIGPTAWTGHVTKWKNEQIMLYFTYFWGGELHWTDLMEKLHAGYVHNVITCAKFQTEIYRGLGFYSGWNFRLSDWVFHGPYDSACNANVLPVPVILLTLASTLKAKAWTFEAEAKAKTMGPKAKAFMYMARAEIKICSMCNSLTS